MVPNFLSAARQTPRSTRPKSQPANFRQAQISQIRSSNPTASAHHLPVAYQRTAFENPCVLGIHVSGARSKGRSSLQVCTMFHRPGKVMPEPRRTATTNGVMSARLQGGIFGDFSKICKQMPRVGRYKGNNPAVAGVILAHSRDFLAFDKASGHVAVSSERIGNPHEPDLVKAGTWEGGCAQAPEAPAAHPRLTGRPGVAS